MRPPGSLGLCHAALKHSRHRSALYMSGWGAAAYTRSGRVGLRTNCDMVGRVPDCTEFLHHRPAKPWSGAVDGVQPIRAPSPEPDCSLPARPATLLTPAHPTLTPAHPILTRRQAELRGTSSGAATGTADSSATNGHGPNSAVTDTSAAAARLQARPLELRQGTVKRRLSCPS